MILQKIKYYLQIIKPGIVFGNLIPFSACFIFASDRNFKLNLFLLTFIGLFLVISGSCVCNNLIDIEIDKNMNRTKNRVLVRKKISIKNAIYYACFLLFIGFFILFYYVDHFSFFLSFLGFFIYVFLYSFIFKKKSTFSLFIGSISGAMPPIIGYYSSSKKINLIFFIFFLIFFLWQIPHFCSIAMFRIKDYKNAKIPILPLKKNIFFSTVFTSFFIILFTICTSFLYFYDVLKLIYIIFFIIINFFWLLYILLGYFYKNKKFFYISFLISVLSNFMISLFISYKNL
ncbi:heme o synthase [Buchnera aphidicola]|uniref:heme o synthase n=1 Tax=Buchnera aphidicola TaxID=9 RepID=UPI0031B8B0B8